MATARTIKLLRSQCDDLSLAPHFGQTFASELISPSHSLHLIKAIPPSLVHVGFSGYSAKLDNVKPDVENPPH